MLRRLRHPLLRRTRLLRPLNRTQFLIQSKRQLQAVVVAAEVVVAVVGKVKEHKSYVHRNPSIALSSLSKFKLSRSGFFLTRYTSFFGIPRMFLVISPTFLTLALAAPKLLYRRYYTTRSSSDPLFSAPYSNCFYIHTFFYTTLTSIHLYIIRLS